MDIKENIVPAKDYLTKSNLPASDYVINPYIGCPHACRYCYARFMKRFTGHSEPWGSFIDIKQCDKKIHLGRLRNKTVFLSSVTDCYNPFEEKYKITRKLLEQLKDADCSVTISTKSSLILRDIDLFRQFKDLRIALSVNTLDEGFQRDMDNASSITDRLAALRELHSQGIHTILFLSPMFPYLTDFKQILGETAGYVCEYWFENLNLRGGYKQDILSYIDCRYPQLSEAYTGIYLKKEMDYWIRLSQEIDLYCTEENLSYINYFYHEALVASKKNKSILLNN